MCRYAQRMHNDRNKLGFCADESAELLRTHRTFAFVFIFFCQLFPAYHSKTARPLRGAELNASNATSEEGVTLCHLLISCTRRLRTLPLTHPHREGWLRGREEQITILSKHKRLPEQGIIAGRTTRQLERRGGS